MLLVTPGGAGRRSSCPSGCVGADVDRRRRGGRRHAVVGAEVTVGPRSLLVLSRWPRYRRPVSAPNSRGQPAVDHEVPAGDPAGLVGQQVDERVSDVERLAEPAEWMAAEIAVSRPRGSVGRRGIAPAGECG